MPETRCIDINFVSCFSYTLASIFKCIKEVIKTVYKSVIISRAGMILFALLLYIVYTFKVIKAIVKAES